MVLVILFWVLFILTAIGALVPDATYPWAPRARGIVILILIGILGWKVLGGHP